jgi:hypothetical protein
MPNIPPVHRQKIQKAMSDPRYWNKKHPEHEEAFANAQRAFEDAYQESPPEAETSPDTVHVRAYTRVQDGKEIEVSAYDRIQQVALRGPTTLEAPSREDIIDVSNNRFHDRWVRILGKEARSKGARIETDVRIKTILGDVLAIADLVVIWPDGTREMYEVKTGKNPKFTLHQIAVYPLVEEGGLVYSDDPKIERLGFKRGEALPSFCVFSTYVKNRLTGPVFNSLPYVCCGKGKNFKVPMP